MTLTTYQRPSGKCACATARVLVMCWWRARACFSCTQRCADWRLGTRQYADLSMGPCVISDMFDHLRVFAAPLGGRVYLNTLSLFCWLRSNLVRHLCLGTAGTVKPLKPQLNQNQTISWSSRDLNPVEIRQGGFLLIQRASDRSALCLFIWRAIFIVYRMIQSNEIDFVSGSREKKRICVILFVFFVFYLVFCIS